MSEHLPLITKYRPADWAEVIGHEATLKALQRAVASKSSPHAFLFTGPSGIGKTTLARILGNAIGADIMEIDAASNNGVDAMRELVEFGQHLAFSATGKRLFIIDECHALSKPAWTAILKILEDPPPHLYLALCTTERGKVIETVLTRCYEVTLKPLSGPEIEDLVTLVCEVEGWQVDKDVFALIVEAATGQPRKALTILQQIHDAPSREEARRIITLTEASDPMTQLLRHLIDGKRVWKIIRPLLGKIDAEAFENADIAASRYIAAALFNTEDDVKAVKIWGLLEALVFPASTYDKKIAFIAAVGRIMWGGG